MACVDCAASWVLVLLYTGAGEFSMEWASSVGAARTGDVGRAVPIVPVEPCP
jgi:hypothetical protein